MMVHYDPEFYRGKRVFVTGHTGFKGSWLCKMLLMAGAEVTGYSLQPPTQPNLFSIAGVEDKMHSVIGDIRDFDALKAAFDAAQPDIVLHLAAQPIVRDSYKDPRYTYETNVMGTVNLLECVRLARQQGRAPRSVLNVTTDKVYHNNEWAWGYRENEPLDGFDPYSNSKSCSELATHSYINSFLPIRPWPSRRPARAMSSAAATLPMTASSPTASAPWPRAVRSVCATPTRPARTSMYWSRWRPTC